MMRGPKRLFLMIILPLMIMFAGLSYWHDPLLMLAYASVGAGGLFALIGTMVGFISEPHSSERGYIVEGFLVDRKERESKGSGELSIPK